MRSRVVTLREMRDRFGAEVKPFAPAFVIPRRYPGWEESEPGAASPGQDSRSSALASRTSRFIEIRPRA